jgi:hypothetical protein
MEKIQGWDFVSVSTVFLTFAIKLMYLFLVLCSSFGCAEELYRINSCIVMINNHYMYQHFFAKHYTYLSPWLCIILVD